MIDRIKTYDGYEDILSHIKEIVKSEPLTEMDQDSLLTKIEGFEYEIGEIISGREEQYDG